MTTIEQWKSRAFIGILAFISITVNASYTRVQRRYQNGAGFVRGAAQGQSASQIATPSSVRAVQYSPAPQPMPVSYTPAAEPPPPLPIAEPAPVSDVQIVAKPQKPALSEEEKLLRKEEREEKKEAHQEATANNPPAQVANVPDTEQAPEEREPLRKSADDILATESDRKDGARTAATRGEAHDAEHSEDSAPHIALQGKNSERPNQGSAMKKAVEVKTTSTPLETKPANPPSEIKTPPLTPSQSELNQVFRGYATGNQSGAQYQSHNSPPNSGQYSHRQTYQPQQNQQNQNNGNNGGNGGHSRR